MTPAKATADFLKELLKELPVHLTSESKGRILAAATPTVAAYYLKGQ